MLIVWFVNIFNFDWKKIFVMMITIDSAGLNFLDFTTLNYTFEINLTVFITMQNLTFTKVHFVIENLCLFTL